MNIKQRPLGNSGIAPGDPSHAGALRLLDHLTASEDSVIAEHARWALRRLSPHETNSLNSGAKNPAVLSETDRKTQ